MPIFDNDFEVFHFKYYIDYFHQIICNNTYTYPLLNTHIYIGLISYRKYHFRKYILFRNSVNNFFMRYNNNSNVDYPCVMGTNYILEMYTCDFIDIVTTINRVQTLRRAS